jgi:hypothetical protein
MTRDDIIKWAREAGIYMGGHPMNPLNVYLGDLERFAALVAAQERKNYEHTLALQQRSYEREIEIEVEAEREACAKLVEHYRSDWDMAETIRARGNT